MPRSTGDDRKLRGRYATFDIGSPHTYARDEVRAEALSQLVLRGSRMSYRTLAASRDRLTPTRNHAPVARSSAHYLPSDVLSLQRMIGNRAVEALLQGSDPASQPGHEPASPAVHHVVGAPGRPLDGATRTFFDARLGHDLSSVRVHTDAEAAESARAVNAVAYTVGPHIVFSSGQYAPATTAGRRVLAHELAHVLQQRDWGSQPRPLLGATTDEWEGQAEAAASAVGRGEQVPHDGAPGGAPPPLLQRQASTIPVRGDIGDVVERAFGFARVPLLPNAVLAGVERNLRAGRRQAAVDVIVDELVSAGEIDRRLLEDGRIRFSTGVSGEAESDWPGFKGSTALPTRIKLGKKAFQKGVPWLLSSILHEYKHVLGFQSPRGLPTIGSSVPGQAATPEEEKDIETYATELLRARETGLTSNPAEIRELWRRLHEENWVLLSHAQKVRLNELYVRAHDAAGDLLGGGVILPFSPVPSL
jgi:hypothetical protein